METAACAASRRSPVSLITRSRMTGSAIMRICSAIIACIDESAPTLPRIPGIPGIPGIPDVSLVIRMPAIPGMVTIPDEPVPGDIPGIAPMFWELPIPGIPAIPPALRAWPIGRPGRVLRTPVSTTCRTGFCAETTPPRPTSMAAVIVARARR